MNMLKKYIFYSFSLSSFINFPSSLSYVFFLSFSTYSLSSVTLSSLFLLLSCSFFSNIFTSPFSFFFPLSLSCVHFSTILFHIFSLNKNLVGVLQFQTSHFFFFFFSFFLFFCHFLYSGCGWLVDFGFWLWLTVVVDCGGCSRH